MSKRGHSNLREDELRRVPNDSLSGDYAMIPICGGASATTTKELPPLALREREWRTIGEKMGWTLPPADLLAACEAVIDWDIDTPGGDSPARRAMVKKALAAIAKAEGRD